jgi:hypothetical protein
MGGDDIRSQGDEGFVQFVALSHAFACKTFYHEVVNSPPSGGMVRFGGFYKRKLVQIQIEFMGWHI